MRDHNNLSAFHLADRTVVEVYKITVRFPKEEIYGITSQMRRAAVSIPTNIVEGCARSSKVEFKRFIEIAFGSARELNYQFGLSESLDYIGIKNPDNRNCKKLIEETEKVVGALFRSI